MQNKENKKTNAIHILIYIILLSIIILLLLNNCTFNKKQETKLLSGNVDIFEINCDKTTCKVENNKDNIDKEQNKDKEIIVNKEEPTKEHEVEIDEGNVIVYDKDITWTSSNNLRIFSNPMYENKSVIAPEDSNTYEFVVRNNTIYNVKYSIKFVETNNYGINLKYKLKRGNKYIVGDEGNWVSYNELDFDDKLLNISESDTYYLEWKWVSSDNDTLVGNNINSNYQLKIEMNAEGIN